MNIIIFETTTSYRNTKVSLLPSNNYFEIKKYRFQTDKDIDDLYDIYNYFNNPLLQKLAGTYSYQLNRNIIFNKFYKNY
jgi:hypothetical protein